MISTNDLKQTRIYLALAFSVALVATACSTEVARQEPTPTTVLEAPAADLAKDYLAAKTSSAGLERLVKTGAFGGSGARFIVKIQGEEVNNDNVDEYVAKYQEQLSLHEGAIRQRGFKTIAGQYTGKATESCARSNAMWAALIQSQRHRAIEITQEDMDAQVNITVEHKGKEVNVKNRAAVAESAMALVEASNSDYYFRGAIKDNIIVFKPDLSVLRTWPKWANPPSQRDLEQCVVTLERI